MLTKTQSPTAKVPIATGSVSEVDDAGLELDGISATELAAAQPAPTLMRLACFGGCASLGDTVADSPASDSCFLKYVLSDAPHR